MCLCVQHVHGDAGKRDDNDDDDDDDDNALWSNMASVKSKSRSSAVTKKKRKPNDGENGSQLSQSHKKKRSLQTSTSK